MSRNRRTSPGVVHVPAAVATLQPFVDAGVLGAPEVHLAAWVVRASGVTDPLVVLGVAMASWAAQHGHACADLAELPEVVMAASAAGPTGLERTGELHLEWPELGTWVAALAAGAPAVRVVDTWDEPGRLDQEPLVLHQHRLYLQRHWVDECTVAGLLRAQATQRDADLSRSVQSLLDVLLPIEVDGSSNQQRLAVQCAATHRVALVVGGPGTGKTYSVARLLAALVTEARSHGRALHIALAAPTGKAAARLKESIDAAVGGKDLAEAVDPNVLAEIGRLAPTTIHRLLGAAPPRRTRFAHDAAHRLPHDVIVIDETSMVSLALLARLLEAVRPEARLVLVGDPDQLESVELGAVLGDLVSAGSVPATPLADHVVRLTRTHRFGGDSPIALLADAVRLGDPDTARLRASASAGSSSVRLVEASDPRSSTATGAVAALVVPVLERLRDAAESADALGALEASHEVRILCAHREGPFGVEAWNDLGERWLCGPAGASGRWYAGRPVLVTRNDARLGLANGDNGVVVRRGDRLRAVFSLGGELVEFDPVQLDSVETAYAMTVHKSQGSEYHSVVLVLPPEHSPLVGRELLYTAVTRARRQLLMVGTPEALEACVTAPARRMTGLARALG